MQPNYLLVFWRFPPGNASTKDSKLCVPGSRQVCQSFQFCGGVPGCWYYPTQSGMQKVSFGGGALIFPPGHPALALALFYQIWPCPCKCPNGHKNGICVCFYPKSAISCRDCPMYPPKVCALHQQKVTNLCLLTRAKQTRVEKISMTVPVALAGVSGILSVSRIPGNVAKPLRHLRFARCHLPCQERLWHSVMFSSKTKSVSSKTKPLCQGLPYQGSWRRRRLRGWTKDAFRVSGITQVLLCTTSPSSSLRSMPPPLVGEALAFRRVFQQNQISFIEHETSLPRAPTLGELASGCETERF